MGMKHDLAEGKKDMAVLEKDNEVRLGQLHEATSGNMLRFVSLLRSYKNVTAVKVLIFKMYCTYSTYNNLKYYELLSPNH